MAPSSTEGNLKAGHADCGFEKLYYTDYEQTSYLGFMTIFILLAYGE